jgi:hypothetical protein
MRSQFESSLIQIRVFDGENGQFVCLCRVHGATAVGVSTASDTQNYELYFNRTRTSYRSLSVITTIRRRDERWGVSSETKSDLRLF